MENVSCHTWALNSGSPTVFHSLMSRVTLVTRGACHYVVLCATYKCTVTFWPASVGLCLFCWFITMKIRVCAFLCTFT